MVLLPNGNALAAGGSSTASTSTALASAEVYNPTTGNWTASGSLANARYYFQMVLLPDGSVLAAGGYDLHDNPVARAEVYSPATGNWTTTGSLAVARGIFQMAGF